VEAVCVVRELHPDGSDAGSLTAIDKGPVEGRVPVGRLGVEGDRQLDLKHHGGPDKAVYAYAAEDVEHWAAELGRELPPGTFGENLRTRGLDVTNALVGERWRVGAAGGLVVEVTMPRTPCATFQHWMDEPRWVKRFTAHGAPGAYLRVVREGTVAAGDEVEVVHRPAHGISIGQCFGGFPPEAGRRLLDAHATGELDLARSLARYARLAAARR
jgi:MOSC domain-containing protein YiiM